MDSCCYHSLQIIHEEKTSNLLKKLLALVALLENDKFTWIFFQLHHTTLTTIICKKEPCKRKSKL